SRVEHVARARHWIVNENGLGRCSGTSQCPDGADGFLAARTALAVACDRGRGGTLNMTAISQRLRELRNGLGGVRRAFDQLLGAHPDMQIEEGATTVRGRGRPLSDCRSPHEHAKSKCETKLNHV